MAWHSNWHGNAFGESHVTIYDLNINKQAVEVAAETIYPAYAQRWSFWLLCYRFLKGFKWFLFLLIIIFRQFYSAYTPVFVRLPLCQWSNYKEYWYLTMPKSNKDQTHYSDVIMSTMASPITGVSIVCITVCSGTDQRKHHSSASLAFVKGMHRWVGEFPPQRASNAEHISIWWHHHAWECSEDRRCFLIHRVFVPVKPSGGVNY